MGSDRNVHPSHKIALLTLRDNPDPPQFDGGWNKHLISRLVNRSYVTTTTSTPVASCIVTAKR